MNKVLLFIIIVFAFEVHASCMSPDIELAGLTKDGKKCEVVINLHEKYVAFEAGKQMCTFPIDEETADELRDHKKKKVVAKGYSNWFDCKAKIFYDDKGRPIKAKLSSRLTLAMTFYHDECFFQE
jgi:hypothetical protein